MATTVDTLLVRVEADLKDVNQKLARFDKQVDSTAKQASRNFQKISNIAKVALGAVIVHQFAQAGMAAVRFASSVEEMQAKSSVVFGAFTGEVRQALDAFGNEVGRSTFELEGMAASIQDTFVPMGFARGEAAKLSVELTKLAVDVASFNNASDTETMAAFQSALVGNHETVRQFGIVITEATLQQELYRMGIKQNAQDVDNATKVQARMNLILAGTTDAQGDAARTSDSFANTSKALKAALDELLVNVVTPLLPALTKMARGLADATGALNNFLIEVGLIEQVGAEGAKATELLAQKQAQLTDQTEALEGALVALNDAQTLANSGNDQAATAVDGLQDHYDGLADRVRKTKEEIEDLATIVVADSFALAKVDDSSKPPEKTKGQIKAEDAVTDALADQRFAVRLLRDEIDGRTSAELKALEVTRDLTAATDDQLNEILRLIREEEKLQAQIDATAAAKKASAELEESINKAIKDSQAERTKVIRELADANQQLEMQVNGVSEEEQLFAEITRDLIGLTSEETEKIKELIAAKVELKNALQFTSVASEQAADATIEVADSFAVVTEEIKKFEEANKEAAKATVIVADSFGLITLEIDKFEAEATEATMMVADSFGVITDEIHKFESKAKELHPMTKELHSSLASMSKGISDSFADMVVSGKMNLDSLQNIFSSFAKTMISKAFELAVINRIMNNVFNLGGTSGELPTIGGKAGGGRISGPTIVGERGPELFVPSSTGVIRNNHDTMNMLGQSGAVVNQTINIDAGVSQTVRAEIMTMMPMFKSQAMEAIIDSRRRGGQVATAFGA